jgi:hypothetical protein
MKNSHHYFPDKILSNLPPMTGHGVIRVYDHLVLANSPLGVRIFLE